jgi:cobalamin-dependent methionine synthase I
MIVGERINPTGKKKLQEQLREGSLEMVSAFAEEFVLKKGKKSFQKIVL